ncbi:MAG: biopolymer transporter ExbD [Candidatus Omnitrophica bacterium]|nr:biopolymer transporter ExbD [Candidatus Omnitrophota bacterium]
MTTNELTPTSEPFHSMLVVAAINLFLLILLILIFSSSLFSPAGFEILMPRAVLSEGLQRDQAINITAENVLYFNDRVVTLNELKKELVKINYKNQNIFIRIDRRSSMGRVMDVWDLCRDLGSSHVHMVTE